MYGEKVDWGCKWFQLWRQHVATAVSLNQRLQVFFFEGRIAQGKIESWDALSADAIQRKELASSRRKFLKTLPAQDSARLDKLSSEARDDAKGEAPGSERGDDEERLFVSHLSEDARCFYEGHKGLGNSQKAEVAWLDKMGYKYDELDVRNFCGTSAGGGGPGKGEKGGAEKGRSLGKG
jgi:hypothetical protein